MARAIAEFTRRRGGYDWPSWTNGKKWRATKGKDYTCSSKSFRSALFWKAESLGMRVTTSMIGDVIEFQFLKG